MGSARTACLTAQSSVNECKRPQPVSIPYNAADSILTQRRAMTIVTRFPPSPTGDLHIGSARTALYNWLYARRHGGRMVLRMEDTDRERSTQAAVDVILEGMRWMGLDYDEGPYYQTQRFERYKEVVDDLLARGKAYRCYCSRERLDALRAAQMAAKDKPRYDGLCRNHASPITATRRWCV